MFSIISTFLYDILREKHSRKYSTTKSVALAATLHLFIGFIVGLVIMYKNQEVDHVLIGEMSAFVLVLLGFKNFSNKSMSVGQDTEPNDKPKASTEEKPSSGKSDDAEGVF
jgi:hypothetical protein